MATAHTMTTAEQLLQAPGLGRCELIRGTLQMMSPAGFRHGRIVSTINRLLATFVVARQLGVVTGAETGFQIAHDPDTVRAPDVAFVRAEQIPATEPVGFFQDAPDLAVEVLSPNDRAGEVTSKVHQWLSAGCSAVWVVDPDSRTVTYYRSRNKMTLLAGDGSVDAGNILPGFRQPAADLFA
jgi:Uma2 family endonuclease